MVKICRGVKQLFFGLAVASGILFTSTIASAETNLEITFPTDRAIFQRDDNNLADIEVTVNCSEDAEVQVQLSEDGTLISDWMVMEQDETGVGVYSKTISAIKGGGWYQIDVKALNKTTGEELAYTCLDRVGVGEVFITAGQSNSCSFGEVKTVANEDLVSSFNPKTDKWQHCEDAQPSISGFSGDGGSAWPTAGDKLVEELGVPVGFVTTGFGGATVLEIIDDHYSAIQDAIDSLRAYGYRSVLYHQGENDASSNTTTEEYTERLLTLIQKTREDAGYELNWIVANAAYYSWLSEARRKEILDGQVAATNNYNIFLGPNTDEMQGDLRASDKVHFSEKGLIEHGTRWADAIIEKLFTSKNIVAENTTNGSFLYSTDQFTGGRKITVTPVANDGYYYKEGTLKVNGGDVEVTNNTFIMLAEDVTIEAEFVSLPQHLLSLGSVIKNAEGTDFSVYTDASVAIVMQAIAEAKGVYANPYATETEALAASTKITDSMKALIKKAVTVPIVSPIPGPVASPQPTMTATLPAKGKVVTKSGVVYRVSTSTANVKTVTVLKLANNKKSAITIAKTITIDGYKYKVTGIEKKAFLGAKKLKSITIKTTTLKNVGKNALKNIYSKATIKVPASKLTAYKKLLKNKGQKSSVRIIK